MKKEGKYRFTLQFGADTEEQIQAGELLERLGNKKSAVVVTALNEYMNIHPGLRDSACKIEVKAASGYDKKRIEQMIRAVIEENLSSMSLLENSDVQKGGTDIQTRDSEIPAKAEKGQEILEDDIAQMLDNLELFQ